MKILYILPSYNVFGGTPRKTLELMKNLGSIACLYVYSDGFSEHKILFEKTKGTIYEGNYGRNIIKHLNTLLSIVDKEKIDIIQSQFTMGELLTFLIKLIRPRIKTIIAFVGSSEPSLVKKLFMRRCYSKFDIFIYISEYVKREKIKQIPNLARRPGIIIYNSLVNSINHSQENFVLNHNSVLALSGINEVKNISILVKSFNILVNVKKRKDIFLYIAGDGPLRKEIESQIEDFGLEKFVYLLGYCQNTGFLLGNCDVFVHPCYAEGFGIAVVEAMATGKPIIASSTGALPELLSDKETGLLVDPFNAEEWAMAIISLIDDRDYARNLGLNAMNVASDKFSLNKFLQNYRQLYDSLDEKRACEKFCVNW